MRTGIDPTVDYAFKRVFATEENAPLLIHFLNAVLEPEPSKRIVAIELLTTVNDRQTADDKVTLVDLRVRDSAGRHYIIEMQLVVTQAFRERILYYGCRDYAQQLQDGVDYAGLMPTIVICIVGKKLFPKESGHHFCFRLTAEGCSVPFTDRLEIHTIELEKFAATSDDLATALDQWLFFLKNGDELEAGNLPESLDSPEVRQAVEVLDMISQAERDRELYEAEFKRRHDLFNLEKLIRGAALEEGREEGWEKGREMGRLIERIQLLSRLLGEVPPAIEELASLSLEVLAEKAADCQARARGRGLPV